MADPIGVALAGYGLAGAILHAPLIEALQEYRIRAVMTSRAEAGNLRDRPIVVPDLDSLLAVDGIDLVVIVTPNDLHALQAEAALRAGKHVLVDKPMAIEVGACDELIDQAAARNLMLAAYHNRRWDGDFRAASALIASGEIGRIALYQANWDRFRPSVSNVWRNRARPGAGLLWDLGPHLIDQSLSLFGWPDAMTSDVAIQREGASTYDYFSVALHYGAMRATLSASTLIAAARPRFALHGERGSWWTEGIDPVEARLRGGEGALADGFHRALTPIPAFRAYKDAVRISEPVTAGDPLGFYRDLARAIRQGTPPPVDPIEARDVVAIIDAAHRGEPLPAKRAAWRLPSAVSRC